MSTPIQRIIESCDQALSGEWDRSDGGFEAMRDDAEAVALLHEQLLAVLEAATDLLRASADEAQPRGSYGRDCHDVADEACVVAYRATRG